MKLRPYQEKGESNILQEWENYLRLMFQLVTGAGKTVIFVNIIKRFLKQGKRVILVAHREELIMQAWKTLYRNKVYGGIIKSGYPANHGLPCQVASIQTIIRRENLPPADLVIFDEAHHCQNDNSYGEVICKHYPDAHVLGVTATPYRLSSHGFKTFFDKLIVSANYVDLKNQGYLVPYKYFVGSFPDLSHVKLSKGDYKDKDAEKAMGMAPLVESYREHCDGKKGVVFAVNVHHSITVAQQYNDAGIPAAHLDGKTPTDERKQILNDFKSGVISIIVNVGIITEGFDFPEMEFVQLARPTKSLSMYLQMVGRVFRVLEDVIRGVESAEERKALIAQSSKPHAFILDNAGCWEEHGLPDQNFDWQMYFEGITNKQMKEAVEYIELIEFVAEDENGLLVSTKNPKEIEGMKLVEVNKQIRERVMSSSSIRDFDMMMEKHRYIPQIKQKGWTTLYKFKDHCKKKFIDISPEIWAHIMKKLYEEPHDEIKRAENYKTRTEEGIRQQYGHNTAEMVRLINGLYDQVKKRVEKASVYYVPIGGIKSQMRQYAIEVQQKPKIPVKL